MSKLDEMARECASEFYDFERKIGNVKGEDGEALVTQCIPVLVGILVPFARTYAIAVLREARDRLLAPYDGHMYGALCEPFDLLNRMADELENKNE